MEQRNLKVAQRLLSWNKAHLIRDAHFEKEALSGFFAEEFQIKVNDRSYDGNHDNYFEFLNGFRTTILSLDYDVQEYIVGQDKVVIPLRATIEHVDGAVRIYDAVMILGFNEAGRIIHWQEVAHESIQEN